MAESKDAIVVDPVMDLDMAQWAISYTNADTLLAYILANNLRVGWILETHAHADHLSASQYIKSQLGSTVRFHSYFTLII
jgi:glyoxylase-like metal-dependent hydrolase (beta-lactamase superfamily II)